MGWVELFAGHAVLPRHDLFETFDREDPEGGRELVHAVVETR